MTILGHMILLVVHLNPQYIEVSLYLFKPYNPIFVLALME
jgi:hypothetical protein